MNLQYTFPTSWHWKVQGTRKFTSSEQARKGLARFWHYQMTWNGMSSFLTSHCHGPVNYLSWFQKPCWESCYIGRGPMELTSCQFQGRQRSCEPLVPIFLAQQFIARQFLQSRVSVGIGFGSPKVSVKQKTQDCSTLMLNSPTRVAT